jgi:phosphoenolpyruvate-protein phosphotransferase (PTS system enzyme I)
MKTFECMVAQEGFFAGPVHVVHSSLAGNNAQVVDAEAELASFREAAASLRESLGGAGHGDGLACGKNADIRDAMRAILADKAFALRVERGICEQHLSAAAALRKVADELSASFEGLSSEYLRARQEDVRGVADELAAILARTIDGVEEPSAFVAEEIGCAQLLGVDEAFIGALLTDRGSVSSHVSIVAGNLGVPYLYGNAEAVAAAAGAEFVVVDSATATVTVGLDESARAAAEARMAEFLREREARRQAEAEAAAASTRAKVFANIAGFEDVEALAASGADGIGLFRTEFLYLGRDAAPSEDEELAAYKAVLEAMGNKPVVIRTMDLGSDKMVPWLDFGDEPNPALGLRGVRVSLERGDVFRTQLRALLRAAPSGNLKVMLPMVASAWEIDEVTHKVQEVAAELAAEGASFEIPELGIMVETPAAVVCADDLAKKAAFFSVGTNDLTQYTLAVDREASGAARYFDAHHEAVFKMLEMTVAAAHKNGIEVGVCGQLAADPAAIARLVGMGVDRLSVPVGKVAATRRLVAEAEAAGGGAVRAGAAGGREPSPTDDGLDTADFSFGDALLLDGGVGAAADGELVPMEEIPAKAFSNGSLGPCFGILPENGMVYAPVAGTVLDVAATKHAVTIAADEGGTVLVHAGIDTATLGGEPFELRVQPGDRVERDELVMKADLAAIERAGLSTMVIVVALKS